MLSFESERLTYWAPSADDFPMLMTLWRNEAFVKHIIGRPSTEEEVWLRLMRDIGYWQVAGFGNWRIRLKSDNAFIGSVGIFDLKRDVVPALDDLELGWGIDPAYQGQGYAFEAVKTALDFADNQLKVARTVCMIDNDNAPSLKLAERTGFVPWCDGNYHDKPIKLLERFRPE